ncbi:DUF5132 domain-containing protein [Paenibacillus frigoriresistens]|uniref:DUF5132 domain-containing protein n=1 Tax=Paenibacillus alginolyticus TaxID=59839 RepID=UPI0015638D7C|nr:DUF5132 domain-containing protein [Paenibacillus frigoriresistens]NRF90864.1 DUF5132 domain-containing protein [Paenibacillus frigoriresistens]
MIQKNIDKIIIGSALAVAASALLPIARSTMQPIAAAGVQGSNSLLQRARSLLQMAREEVEDIVAEAQFERMKKQLDKEIASLNDEEK